MLHKDKCAAAAVMAHTPSHSSGWSSLYGPASILIAVAAVIYAFSLLRCLPQRANRMDFTHYYVSALMMRQGSDPYVTNMKPLAESLGLEGLDFSHATYTPTFLLLFEPLTLLIPLAAYWVWIAITIAFLAMTLYLLLDGVPRDYRLRLALVGLVILYQPITDNFFFAQSQIMLLFLFTLFMRGMGSGRHAFAGSIVGLAGLLKVFPLVLVGYLLTRRRWEATFYAGLVLVVGGLVTLALVGV